MAIALLVVLGLVLTAAVAALAVVALRGQSRDRELSALADVARDALLVVRDYQKQLSLPAEILAAQAKKWDAYEYEQRRLTDAAAAGREPIRLPGLPAAEPPKRQDRKTEPQTNPRPIDLDLPPGMS